MKLSQADKQVLRQATAIKELAEHPGYKEYLKPLLETKLNQSFPDPSQFEDEKKFTYAALTASVFKKVIVELMMYFEANEQAYKDLQTKKFKKHNAFEIGK
jgi:hypothetical protein